MRSLATLLAALVMGAATTNAASAQVTQLEFPRWPAELAPRAPLLSAAIERDFGQRPRWMIYGGQDSLKVMFVNAGLWSTTDTSEEIPKESIELAHEAAKHVAKFVWNNFGRDAHLNNLIVYFFRVRRESHGLPSREVPHGHVEVHFTRQDLETGHLEHGQMLVPIYGGTLHPGQQLAPASPNSQSNEATPENVPRPDLFVRGPPVLHPRGWALGDSIEREFGERPHEIDFTSKDTLDVTFWNPTFWRSDMHSKEFLQASMPVASQTAARVAGYLWSRYARDAGVNVIRITFVRTRRVNTGNVTSDVPVQKLTAQLTRKQLETGTPQLVSLTMTQR